MDTAKTYTAKDFATDQDVRWCPGCGDYSILKQMQSVAAELSLDPDSTVFISGIGCSSRFPYYMNTYGMHSIHGRATAIVSGLRAVRKDLSIWIITGDGDSLSIGGNHLIHLLRRNFNVNVLMFNNEIYGLTKGQYSPTSPEGQITKSTPMGSLDHPFNPLSLALGADATYVARSMDRDPMHLRKTLKNAHEHKGTSFVEIYQNCNVFNDGAFGTFTDKGTKDATTLFMEHGQPLTFDKGTKGLKLDGFTPRVVTIAQGTSLEDLWVHDENDYWKGQLLSRMFEAPGEGMELPRPFGTFYKSERPCYEDLMNAQVEEAIKMKGEGNLDDLLRGNKTWEA